MTLYSDKITPFLLHESDVRGRFVRLGATVDTILNRHNYPQPVSKLLGELLLVAAMLSSNLKHEGIVTLQMKGNGAVPMMVADAVYGGAIRGYADVKEGAEIIGKSPRALLGDNAYLAITLDAEAGERYQGVVELEGESIVDALNAYFRNSQQMDVAFKLAVSKGLSWVAGGAMIERLPSELDTTEEAVEAWHYAKVMLQTLKDEELLDISLDAGDLLYRLYHEQGVIAYDAKPLTTACRCSRERIQNLLISMPREDREHALVDGKVSVHCQFCNTTQEFTSEQISL
jgi:molecular chaperone Hsp33